MDELEILGDLLEKHESQEWEPISALVRLDSDRAAKRLPAAKSESPGKKATGVQTNEKTNACARCSNHRCNACRNLRSPLSWNGTSGINVKLTWLVANDA